MSRVCMLAHSYFPQNPRTRLQAVSVAAAGHDVEVICPKAPGEPKVETYQGVRVTRVPVTRDRSRGMLGYLFEYARFFALATSTLSRRESERHFDVVVAHNIPEQLVYAALPSKRRGAAVALDVHDPLPELFAEKFGRDEDSALIRFLQRLEVSACRFADHVFVATDPLKDRLVNLGYPAEKVTPILNSPQVLPPPKTQPQPYVVVYHGTIVERYGLETVLEALALSAQQAPHIELHLFGSDVDAAYLDRLKRTASELGVADRVAFSGYVAPLALRQVLSSADLGIVSMRRPSHIDLAYPMKLFEYLASGVPVLSVRTEPLEELFAGEVAFYEESDAEDLARALARLANSEGPRRSLLPPRDGRLAEELSWPEQERRYLEVVERLSASAVRVL